MVRDHTDMQLLSEKSRKKLAHVAIERGSRKSAGFGVFI